MNASVNGNCALYRQQHNQYRNNIMTGEMRIWYMQQVGEKGIFYKPVSNIEVAVVALDTVYELMLFLLEGKIIPDFTNQGGVQVRVKNPDTGDFEWLEWESEEGYDINTLIDSRA